MNFVYFGVDRLNPSTNFLVRQVISLVFHECRHHILYLILLGPPFSNDGSTLKPKVRLGPNQNKIDLRKVFVENITYFWKNKTIFGKDRPRETLSVRTHTCVCVHTLKPCVHMLTTYACIHS